MNLFDFSLKTLDGKEFPTETLKDKKVLIVNTASKCGYTFHYEILEKLYQQYKDKNFTILAFPCNDFGGQEPGGDVEIASFCAKNYGVSFPIMEKISILGEKRHPLYKWLCDETKSEVAWNFQKYLVDEHGKIMKMLAHGVSPDDQEIITWIEA
jgi:glutathione peroxidase